MLLTANREDRTITGMLLPYGQVGRTNKGGVTASADAPIMLASDITLNLEHDAKRPLGRVVGLPEVTPAGLVATFKVAATTAGDDLLAEVAEGLRTGLSVEIDQPVIRAGRLLGGTVTAAAAVVAPAFDSARIMTAADAGDEPDENDTPPPEQQPEDTTDQPGEQPEEENTMPETAVTEPSTQPLVASAPAGGLAARHKPPAKPEGVDSLFASLAKAHATGDQHLLAALDQGIAADLAPAQAPTWAGEIWARRTHRQRFIPLFTPGPLNALKITGWKFAPRTGTPPQPPATPTVGTYAGYPAEPTSTEVKTGPVTINAARLAGANEFDRGFVDFDTPEFWAGFYRESANDLSRKLDAAAEAHLLTPANYTAVAGGVVPTGVATAAAAIVDGFLAIQDVAVPDFAIIGVDLWREFVLTRKEDALEYLEAALSLDPAEGRLKNFTFVPSSHATVAGKVLVGASDSHTFYGPKTVRASTISIANGGIQEGLFGYWAANTGSEEAFALVTPDDGE